LYSFYRNRLELLLFSFFITPYILQVFVLIFVKPIFMCHKGKILFLK